MPEPSHHLLSVAILWLHLASMAVVLGGALLLWALSVRQPDGVVSQAAVLFIAQRYEWLFWGAMALLVMTGVGNLGAFGRNLPATDTGWGAKLTVKLAAVVLFLLLSLLRTLLVARLAAGVSGRTAGSNGGPAAVQRGLGHLYAGTVLSVAGIAALGVSLANG